MVTIVTMVTLVAIVTMVTVVPLEGTNEIQIKLIRMTPILRMGATLGCTTQIQKLNTNANKD